MAKYGKGAQKKVEEVMHEYKHGKLKSGRGGKGGKVKSRKQAIAIGLSEARERGAKVPKKKGASKKAASKKSTGRKRATKKRATKRSAPKKSATKRATRRTGTKRATKSRPKKASRRSR